MIDTAKVRSRIAELIDRVRDGKLTNQYGFGYCRGSVYVLLEEIDRLRAEKAQAWRVGDEAFATFHEAEDAAFSIAGVPFSVESIAKGKRSASERKYATC